MGRRKHFYEDQKMIRDRLNEVVDIGKQIHILEAEFVSKLRPIDRHRYFVRYSHTTLKGFLVRGMGFSRTQAQRIVTQVRRLSCPETENAEASSIAHRADVR